MSRNQNLAIVRDETGQLAEQDGPWVNAKQIASDLYDGQVTPRWVRDNVPGKHKFGHSTVLWRRNRVVRWMATCEEKAAS